MRNQLSEQHPELVFCEPDELDTAIMGVSARISGETQLAYDLKTSVAIMKAQGYTEDEALEHLAEQAKEVNALFVDASLGSSDPKGTVTVTQTEDGTVVAVTRTDEEGRILSVIWEK